MPSFLYSLDDFRAGTKNDRHRYQVNVNEIENIENLITNGDFDGLIAKKVSASFDGNNTELFPLEIIGARLAEDGNKENQIRRVFNDLKQIQQRVDGLHQHNLNPSENVELAALKENVNTVVEQASDVDSLLSALEQLVAKYRTSGPVKNEIELSLALARSKIFYSGGKFEGIAQDFFTKSIDAVLADIDYNRFQAFVKSIECAYAYFHPLAG